MVMKKSTKQRIMRQALTHSLKRTCGLKSKNLYDDAGRGWVFKREGNMMWFGVDTSKPGKLSNSKKSFCLATTNGPYGMEPYGLDDYFVIAHFCKMRPLKDQAPLADIVRDIKEEGE